ncbi:hypothetical protein MKW94_003401 [Papaver nudicaule]|uniref:Fe2OG dioxygenase domain-containing protein n=1 Tax=Papaver nudicaule TaxID=74823 RepID=A0AA41S2K6_PAPNU|nr:hypothetical protein [Papaver nudicaule]
MISLCKVIEGNKDDNYRKACHNMVAASEKWGFFKLIDHGVKFEIIENMKNMCNDLFDLPMEKKMKGGRLNGLPLGYSATNPDYGKNWTTDGLGLPSDFFSKNFKEEKEATMIRVNRYPKCPLPKKCLGLGSHSDPPTLTILLQDDEVGGLQVLRPIDDQWVGIRPVSNSFVINIGDTLESVVHRAVVNKEKSRLSAAYFLSPSSKVTIESPPQLIPPISSNAKMYKPFTWGDFRKELLS